MCHESCPKPITGGAPLTEQMVTVSRDDAEIPILLVQPEDTSMARPGIVLIHDIHGANDFYHDVARRLANEQLIVALPDLFHREGPVAGDSREATMARSARAKQENQLADLEAIAGWLLDQDGCNGMFGYIGFCMGGTLTFLGAARTPTPTAAVAFYGFPAKPATDNAPIRPIDDSEVTALHAPVLGLWGDQDGGVGMDNVTAYDDALTRLDKPHEFVVYPRAGHAFLTFDDADDTFETSQFAWHRALAFLDAQFTAESGAS